MSWVTAAVVTERKEEGAGRSFRVSIRVNSIGRNEELTVNVAPGQGPFPGEKVTLVRSEGGNVIGLLPVPFISATELRRDP